MIHYGGYIYNWDGTDIVEDPDWDELEDDCDDEEDEE